MKTRTFIILVMSLTLSVAVVQGSTSSASSALSASSASSVSSVSSADKDTTTISIGNREINIVENEGQTNVNVSNARDNAENIASTRPRNFKGNWSGFEIGMNNFINRYSPDTMTPEGYDFMELKADKSLNVSINIKQYDFGIVSDKIGLVTGLGLEFNDYRFSNNNNIQKAGGAITNLDYDALGINLEKSKLSSVYITVPLLLEFQSGNARRSRRVHFSAGVTGGIKIGSHTKIVYRENSKKQKDKIKDDFYLSPFRYGLTVRAGYRSLNIFANVYPTPLFEKNKGPELYPFSIGFSILSF